MHMGFEADKTIPFSRPSLGEEEIAAVAEVLRSGWITSGPKVKEFEREFAAYVCRRKAIAVQSGTAALFICLQALDLPPTSEVIMPALTWASAVSAALCLRLVPVMADVDPETLNIAPDGLEARITSKSRAIVPVHFAGLPYDVDLVTSIARRRGLAIIDDSAHAAGAKYKNDPVGRRALASCYSFHPIKNMTTGEGGMIATDDDRFAEKLVGLRFLGVNRDAWSRYGSRQSFLYDVTRLALKHNMTDIQAAIGIVQLRKLEMLNRKRQLLAYRYLHELSGLQGLILPDPGDEERSHSWHLFAVRTEDEKSRYGRDEVVEKLAQQNISTGIHFISIPDLSYFREELKLDPADTPNAVRAGRTIFSLPLYPDLAEEDQKRVVEALRKIFS